MGALAHRKGAQWHRRRLGCTVHIMLAYAAATTCKSQRNSIYLSSVNLTNSRTNTHTQRTVTHICTQVRLLQRRTQRRRQRRSTATNHLYHITESSCACLCECVCCACLPTPTNRPTNQPAKQRRRPTRCRRRRATTLGVSVGFSFSALPVALHTNTYIPKFTSMFWSRTMNGEFVVVG